MTPRASGYSVPLRTNTSVERAAAARCIARNAVDAVDRIELLAAVGLDPRCPVCGRTFEDCRCTGVKRS